MPEFMPNNDLSQPIIQPTTTRRKFIGMPVEDIKMTGEYLANKFRSNKLNYYQLMDAAKKVPTLEADKDIIKGKIDNIAATFQENAELGDWTNAEYKVIEATDTFVNDKQVKDMQLRKIGFDNGLNSIATNDKIDQTDKETGSNIFTVLNNNKSQWDENGNLINNIQSLYIPDHIDEVAYAKKIIDMVGEDGDFAKLTSDSGSPYYLLNEGLKTKDYNKIRDGLSLLAQSDDKLKERFKWEAYRDGYKNGYINADKTTDVKTFNSFIDSKYGTLYDESKGKYIIKKQNGVDSKQNPVYVEDIQNTKALNEIIENGQTNPKVAASIIQNSLFEDKITNLSTAAAETGNYIVKDAKYLENIGVIEKLKADLDYKKQVDLINYQKPKLQVFGTNGEITIEADKFLNQPISEITNPVEKAQYRQRKKDIYKQMLNDPTSKAQLLQTYEQVKANFASNGLTLTATEYVDLLINGEESNYYNTDKFKEANSNYMNNASIEGTIKTLDSFGMLSIVSPLMVQPVEFTSKSLNQYIQNANKSIAIDYSTRTPLTISSERILHFTDPGVGAELSNFVNSNSTNITDGKTSLADNLKGVVFVVGQTTKNGEVIPIEKTYEQMTPDEKNKMVTAQYSSGNKNMFITANTKDGIRTFEGSDNSGTVTASGFNKLINVLQTDYDTKDDLSYAYHRAEAVNFMGATELEPLFTKLGNSVNAKYSNLTIPVRKGNDIGVIENGVYMNLESNIIKDNELIEINTVIGKTRLTKAEFRKQYPSQIHVFTEPISYIEESFDGNKPKTVYKLLYNGQPTKDNLQQQVGEDLYGDYIDYSVKNRDYKTKGKVYKSNTTSTKSNK